MTGMCRLRPDREPPVLDPGPLLPSLQIRHRLHVNSCLERGRYEHARKVQQERNQLARICEQLSFDIRTLRQALSEECPERYGHYVNQPEVTLHPDDVAGITSCLGIALL